MCRREKIYLSGNIVFRGRITHEHKNPYLGNNTFASGLVKNFYQGGNIWRDFSIMIKHGE